MNPQARIGAIVGALLAFSFAAPAEAARKPKELLQYIPADTPYVMAFVKPLPDDLLDKMEPAIDETLTAYRNMIEFMLEDAAAKQAGNEGDGGDEGDGSSMDEAELRRLRAVTSEFMSMLSVRGLRDAGIGRDSLFAMYGDGLMPVIRFALTDGEKFDAAIARLEEKAEAKLQVGELRGTTYQYVDLDGKARLVISTPQDDVVIALVPAAYGDARLAGTLGIEKPRQSLARSKALDRIAKDYGFTDHVVGFFDVERIAAAFLGDPSGLNSELFELMEYDASRIDSNCRAEFTELAKIAPRMVIGYTSVDKRHMDASMIVELRDDIAAGLATLPAAVPGLGADPGGLFSFGFSLNPLALRTFYESRLDAMEKDPFTCAALADLQASTVKGREALAQPVPPLVYSFRGMVATVRDITGFDFASKQPPESVDASILFAIDNAQDIVNMAALMDPRVAALNLLPDGKARQLDLPELGAMAGQVFAALSNGGLAISVGDGADRNAEAMLVAKAPDQLPIMSLSMDAKRYYAFVAEAVMQAEANEEDEEAPTPLEVRQAMRDIMLSSGSVYERLSTTVHLTTRGIEIGTRVTLAE